MLRSQIRQNRELINMDSVLTKLGLDYSSINFIIIEFEGNQGIIYTTSDQSYQFDKTAICPEDGFNVLLQKPFYMFFIESLNYENLSGIIYLNSNNISLSDLSVSLTDKQSLLRVTFDSNDCHVVSIASRSDFDDWDDERLFEHIKRQENPKKKTC